MKKTDTKNDKIKEHVTKTANSYKDDISFILYLQLLESLNVGDDNALHQICQQILKTDPSNTKIKELSGLIDLSPIEHKGNLVETKEKMRRNEDGEYFYDVSDDEINDDELYK